MTVLLKSNVVNSPKTRHVAVTVAGFDPSSGAGVTADLKVFAAHGVYGLAAITALTVQSTQGVRSAEPVRAGLVRETLECLGEDMEIEGMKIGMLGRAGVVRELAAFLRSRRIARERVVLDPVVRSSSGAELLDEEGVQALREELLPMVGWVTPNVDEAAVLAGEGAAERGAVPRLARLLAACGGLNVVVTGGHLEPPDDYLLTASGEEVWLPGRRVETTSTHGTGCAFSSALLCRVLAGEEAGNAVRGAKAWVLQALETAPPVGRGRGPVV